MSICQLEGTSSNWNLPLPQTSSDPDRYLNQAEWPAWLSDVSQRGVDLGDEANSSHSKGPGLEGSGRAFKGGEADGLQASMKSIRQRGHCPRLSGMWKVGLASEAFIPPSLCDVHQVPLLRLDEMVMLRRDHPWPVGHSTKLSLWGLSNHCEKHHWNKWWAEGL